MQISCLICSRLHHEIRLWGLWRAEPLHLHGFMCQGPPSNPIKELLIPASNAQIQHAIKDTMIEN